MGGGTFCPPGSAGPTAARRPTSATPRSKVSASGRRPHSRHSEIAIGGSGLCFRVHGARDVAKVAVTASGPAALKRGGRRRERRGHGQNSCRQPSLRNHRVRPGLDLVLRREGQHLRRGRLRPLLAAAAPVPAVGIVPRPKRRSRRRGSHSATAPDRRRRVGKKVGGWRAPDGAQPAVRPPLPTGGSHARHNGIRGRCSPRR